MPNATGATRSCPFATIQLHRHHSLSSDPGEALRCSGKPCVLLHRALRSGVWAWMFVKEKTVLGAVACPPHSSRAADARAALGSSGRIPPKGHSLSCACSRQLKMLVSPPNSSRIKYFPLCSLLCVVPSWATPYVLPQDCHCHSLLVDPMEERARVQVDR